MDDYELSAMNNVSMRDEDDDEDQQQQGDDQRGNPANEPTAAPVSMEDRMQAALRRQGVVVAPAATAPYGDDDEEVTCGVCLDAPPPGQLATLWCCKNVLCLKDAQLIGACPFCREDPLVWELGLPQDVHPNT